MDNLDLLSDQLDEIQNEEIPHGQPNQEEEFAQYHWQFMWSGLWQVLRAILRPSQE